MDNQVLIAAKARVTQAHSALAAANTANDQAQAARESAITELQQARDAYIALYEVDLGIEDQGAQSAIES